MGGRTRSSDWSAFSASGSPVSRDEAEAFVGAAEQLVEHMAQVMADTFPDPGEG